MSGEPITLCVTSCGRPDLLARTLNSLLAGNAEAFAARLLIDDAGDERIATHLRATGWGEGILLNEERLGQMRSIDRLYGEVATPLIFHCEDDWLFNETPFVEACRTVLAAEPKASSVCVRKLDELPARILARAARKQAGGVRYVTLPLDAHPEWFGMSFNPGLTQLSLWRQYGPYAAHGTEAAISLRLKQDGFSVAYLDPGHCVHIGDGQHVADPFQPRRPTGLFGRLRRSAEKRFLRLKRRMVR